MTTKQFLLEPRRAILPRDIKSVSSVCFLGPEIEFKNKLLEVVRKKEKNPIALLKLSK